MRLVLLTATAASLLSGAHCAPQFELSLSVPPGGPVLLSQPLSAPTVAKLADTPAVWVLDGSSSRRVPSQWQPSPDDGGVITWVRPQTTTAQTFAIRPSASPSPSAGPMRVGVARTGTEVTIDTGLLTVRHDLSAGGLPTGFRPRGAAEMLPLRWQDRLYSPERGEWSLSVDASPGVTVTAEGPLRAQVVVRAQYSRDDAPAPGAPQATYVFTYTAGSALVGLDLSVQAADPYVWEQLHTVELSGFAPESYYLDAECRPERRNEREDFVYADSALLASSPQATVGIVRDPAGMSRDQERLALWDPAEPKTDEQRAGYVPPYIRGPWLWGWRGEYAHSLTLAFLPPGLTADKAQSVVGGVLHPPAARVTTSALQALRRACLIPATGDKGAAAVWWFRGYANSHLHRRLEDLQALADRGQVAEAEQQCDAVLEESREPWKTGTSGRPQGSPAVPTLAPGSGPQAWAAETESLVAIGTTVAAAAVATDTPVRLASLRGHGGQDLAREECHAPILRAMLRLPDGSELLTGGADLECTARRISTDSDGAYLSVTMSEEVATEVRLRAQLTCRVSAGSQDTRWSLRLEASGAAIEWVRFPNVACAPIGGRGALNRQVAVSPRALNGNFIRHPFGSRALQERSPFGSQWEPATMMYPQLSMPVQMTCLTSLTPNGEPTEVLYAACEDSRSYYKAFQYVSSRDDVHGPGLQAAFVHIPEGPGTAARYTIPYETILSPLSGGWFDAVEHYRAWAVGQPWCARGPLVSRTDQPKWVRETPLWLFVSGINDPQVQSLSDCADLLDVPIGAHLYDWHSNPFDCRMPEYFPPRRGEDVFPQDIATWRPHGVHTVPYIQGVLWDMLTESWRTEGAEPFATRGQDGTISQWTSNPGTPHEGHCAEMCMTTDYWHGKLEGYVRQLQAYGVDGVYLDSVGCGAWPCYAEGHGHPPGRGGTWWADGVRRLMERLRDVPGPDGRPMVYTTEGFNEASLDGFDAFLPHIHHPRPDEGCVYDAL